MISNTFGGQYIDNGKSATKDKSADERWTSELNTRSSRASHHESKHQHNKKGTETLSQPQLCIASASEGFPLPLIIPADVFASKNNSPISPISSTSTCCRPARPARMDAGVSNCRAYLAGQNSGVSYGTDIKWTSGMANAPKRAFLALGSEPVQHAIAELETLDLRSYLHDLANLFTSVPVRLHDETPDHSQ